MNESTTDIKQQVELCPVDGAICDRKCGYKAHGTLKRANRCLVCNNILTPVEDETHCFQCDTCDPEHKVIISIG